MSITADSSVVIPRSVSDVFAFVTDCRNEPLWHTDVIEAAPIDEGPLAVGKTERWVLRYMGRRENTMRVTEFVPDSLISLAGEKRIMGTRATLTYIFEPKTDGMEFTRHVAIELSGAARLMEPMMRVMVPRRNREFVQNLKALLGER